LPRRRFLQELGVDFIDESEVLTPADEAHHIDKHAFTTPFVCGARNLGEALRRIAEGAAMIRTKGEAGTGDVVHAVQHMRQITREMRALTVLSEQELYAAAKDHQAPYELVRMVAQTGKLPVPNFSAGGIATPADAALMMQLGAEAIFVGSGIFMKERATPLDVENDPKEREEAVSRAKAIVIATTHFNDPKILAEVSEQVTGTMKGLAAAAIEESQLLQTRGWFASIPQRVTGNSSIPEKDGRTSSFSQGCSSPHLGLRITTCRPTTPAWSGIVCR
jgi:pyridoxal 5'-phosphate synthase pdxS subunit